MKITREQIYSKCAAYTMPPIAAAITDWIIPLIDQREAEIETETAELVEAVGDLLASWIVPHVHLNETCNRVKNAYEKLCPPPDPHKELAGRLIEAIDGNRELKECDDCRLVDANKLREIAAEIEKLGELI